MSSVMQLILTYFRMVEIWFLLRMDCLDFQERSLLEVVLKDPSTSIASSPHKKLLMLLLENNNIPLRR